MYRDLSKYVNEVFAWLGSAPEDPSASLPYYVSEVRIECDNNAVGTFTLDFDNEYDFKVADTWVSAVKADEAEPTVFARTIANQIDAASNNPCPATNDGPSFVHGYTTALADIYKILGVTPEGFDGVVLPGPKGAL